MTGRENEWARALVQERYAIRRPELGHGAFGAVYAGQCLRSGEPVGAAMPL
jgi:hypothetical protein